MYIAITMGTVEEMLNPLQIANLTSNFGIKHVYVLTYEEMKKHHFFNKTSL